MNKVVLIGRLCNNPEIRYVGEKNSAITSFLIAVNRNFKNPEGNYDADFIECNLWGRRAEVFCQYMSKGSLVGISGSLRLDKFTDKLGNDIEKLIETFKSVKDINHPIVVHINTQKGKGYEPAEENKESWHWCMPFDKETGKPTVTFDGESYESLTCEYLLKKMKADPTVTAITAGVPTNIGFTEDKRKEAGKQFIDVGIAEKYGGAHSMAQQTLHNGRRTRSTTTVEQHPTLTHLRTVGKKQKRTL